ncbi:hypothetical protein JW935_08195 [candidate division KSB1 bacterium]|nr:hypothetical protein [candidate division KSB1 bacterium]
MKKLSYFIVLMISVNILSCRADSHFKNFITADGNRLYDGDRPFAFISFNIPNLFYVEDELAFENINPWRFPDEFEIRDALESVRQTGGQVCRTYTLSVRNQDDPDYVPKFVTGPGEFNEEAFLTLDKVLQLANETGVRLIIPFVDNWKWWGGIAEYAAFKGKSRNAFWTDPKIREDFKKTIKYVLERKNVYTGIQYKDDKAILAWETGNELQSPAPWTAEMAAYIKSIDKNHLVMDGFHSSLLRDESLAIENIDIVTTHHYPQNPQQLLEQLGKNVQKLQDKKAYIIGEFGFIDTPGIEAFLNKIIEFKVGGALIWSLRYHRREGGFYWHSEPFGGDLYKAYHWPGFPSGAEYDETNLLALMRRMAYRIQDMEPSPLPVPVAPVLLPISDISHIFWQGSCGASGYDIQRSESDQGPWHTIAENVSDAAVQYRALFQDKTAEPGNKYFYRIIARNQSGYSQPSNVQQGTATKRTLIDEMADSSMWFDSGGEIKFVSKQARQVKEDIFRVELENNAFITYSIKSPDRCEIYAFFPEEISDILTYFSTDGREWKQAGLKKQSFRGGEGDYGYFTPVLFTAAEMEKSAQYVKIVVPKRAIISRIQIDYGS